MFFSSHRRASTGGMPQLVGQVERTSTRVKQVPSRLVARRRAAAIALALTACSGVCTDARAMNAGVRSVESSSATRIGCPASSTSRPSGQVVATWPGIVVGAIWPPVMP